MIGLKRVVEDDLFSIVKRLKSIDPTYFVVENYEKNRLELHCSAQWGSTLSLVLPYRILDERTVRYVLQTRTERKKKLLEEIENANARLINEQARAVIKKTEKEVENVYSNL